METNDPLTLAFPHGALQSLDIVPGADPFVFYDNGRWRLLIQEHLDSHPYAHDGIAGYTLRSSQTIEGLLEADAVPLIVAPQPEGLHEAWAAELHFKKYLYVALSDGDNRTHRMHVYETSGDLHGPWHYGGPLTTPESKYWAIDLTFVSIPFNGQMKQYGIWSGWEESSDNIPESLLRDVVPQHIYIAECISPFELGPRHTILSPVHDWCLSPAKVLEGPQPIYRRGTFWGISVAGNASWTTDYVTRALAFRGGDPLNATSWEVTPQLLFPTGHGIGHGMFVAGVDHIYFVGHRKTVQRQGWDDRHIFAARFTVEDFETLLDSGSGKAHRVSFCR